MDKFSSKCFYLYSLISNPLSRSQRSFFCSGWELMWRLITGQSAENKSWRILNPKQNICINPSKAQGAPHKKRMEKTEDGEQCYDMSQNIKRLLHSWTHRTGATCTRLSHAKNAWKREGAGWREGSQLECEEDRTVMRLGMTTIHALYIHVGLSQIF